MNIKEYKLNLVNKHFRNEIDKSSDDDASMHRQNGLRNYSHENLGVCLDYWINEFGIDLKDLVNSGSNKLVEVLFGYRSISNTNKLEYIDMFKEELNNNIDFYKSCLLEMLERDIYPKENVFDEDLEKSFKKNIEVFDYMLEIGIANNYFFKINQEEIRTENPFYREILKEKNIHNEKFDINNFEKLLVPQKDKKIAIKRNQFVSTYNKEILSYLSEESNLKSFLFEQEDSFSILLTLLLTKTTDLSEKDNLCKIVSNNIFRKEIMDKYNGLMELLVKSNLNIIGDFLKAVDYKEEVYKLGYYRSYKETGSNITGIMAYLDEHKIYNNEAYEIIDYGFELIKNKLLDYSSKYTKEELENNRQSEDREINMMAIENKLFIFNYLNKYITNNVEEKDYESLKNLFIKNQDDYVDGFILNGFKDHSKLSFKNIKNLLNEDEYNNFINKISKSICFEIEEIINNKTPYIVMNKKETFINGLPKIMDTNDIYNPILSYIYDKSYNNKSVSMTSYGKTNGDLKIIKDVAWEAQILIKTNGGAIKWYIENNKEEDLLKIKHKNKNILSVLLQSDYYLEILENIYTNQKFFNESIVKNKSLLKILLEKSDSNVNALIMSNKISANMPEKKHIKAIKI